MANPCKYTLKDGTVLDFSQARQYVMDNIDELTKESPTLKAKYDAATKGKVEEGGQPEYKEGDTGREAPKTGGRNRPVTSSITEEKTKEKVTEEQPEEEGEEGEERSVRQSRVINRMLTGGSLSGEQVVKILRNNAEKDGFTWSEQSVSLDETKQIIDNLLENPDVGLNGLRTIALSSSKEIPDWFKVLIAGKLNDI